MKRLDSIRKLRGHMASSKEKTFEQAAAMQEKAVRFLRDVVGDDEKADEIESL